MNSKKITKKITKKREKFPKGFKGFLIWLTIVFVAVLLAQYFYSEKERYYPINYTQFIDELNNSNVSSVSFKGKELKGRFNREVLLVVNGKEVRMRRFKLRVPFENSALVDSLVAQGVEVEAKEDSSWWQTIFISFLPWILIIFLWLFLMRRVQGGRESIFSFGQSRAKRITPDMTSITFKNVAGVEEAKAELVEIVDFLKKPEKYLRLGARIPKGILLMGPPGTGKTLLARAVAGEAKVPFFSMSGSDFVELFVGIGAARVRDLFSEAKKNSPSIIFIDEIDAVGRHRGSGLGGGHDEREQTLNQLLVEMDGFEVNQGVIVIAATNRPDILDPALLRTGRFDRRIVLDLPDVKAREAILEIHMRKLPQKKNIDLSIIAKTTPGLSGADLESIVNEAALLSARKGKKIISQAELEEARDKVMMGAERRSLVITEDEKNITAYHEAGHALIAKLLPGVDPIHKVSIIPRGFSLGLTHYLPEKERRLFFKSYLKNKLVTLLGGRAAEKVIFKDISTGAANDLEQASKIARNMVVAWGMSEKLGPIYMGETPNAIFLGRELIRHRSTSDKTAQLIDEEVKSLVEQAEEKAIELIQNNLDKLKRLAKALLEKETLTGMEIEALIADGSQE